MNKFKLLIANFALFVYFWLFRAKSNRGLNFLEKSYELIIYFSPKCHNLLGSQIKICLLNVYTVYSFVQKLSNVKKK